MATKYKKFTGIVNEIEEKEKTNKPTYSKTGRKLFQGTLEPPKNSEPATYDIPTNEKQERTLFSVPNALDDGFQFKDIFTITFKTAGDILTDVVHGVASVGEGIVDAGRYGISAVARKFGNEKLANDMVEMAKQDTLGMIFNPADKYFDEGSILGDKIDNVIQSVGYMGGIYGTAGLGASGASAAGLSSAGVKATATAVSTGTTFSAAFGNSASQAYNEGATDSQAMRYGLISGLGEAGTELLFGGMGQLIPGIGLSTGVTNIDDVAARKVSDIFKKQWQKNLAQYTIKSSFEGIEEVLSGLIQATGQYITYKTKEQGYTWGELVKDQNLLEQFISGAVVSAIAQTPGLIQSTRSGKDFVTNLTLVEEERLTKETNEEITKREKELGRELTPAEKNDIKRKKTNSLEINNSLDDVLKASGITTETINKITDVDTANEVIKQLLTMYTSFVPVDNLDAHINSNVYSRLVEAEAKRNELMQKQSELEKIDKTNELQNKLQEVTPNTTESILVTNEINAINKELDKNNKIPVMQNRTFVTKYSLELMDEARQLLDERGFEGEIMTNITLDEKRIEDVGAIFGKQVIFLQGADFAGVVLPEQSNIIFINEEINNGLLTTTDNKNKMLYTLGHELYHSMKMTDPETYNQFIDYVKSELTSEQLTTFMNAYDNADTDHFYAKLKINGEYNISELLAHPEKYPSQTAALNRIVEEMVANEFGGMITDAKYMRNLKAKNETLFGKVVKLLRDFFKSLTKPIYKTSLTQIQISEIRDRFENIVAKIQTEQTQSEHLNTGQTTSPAKTSAKVENVAETVVEKTGENVEKVAKKPAKNVEKQVEKVQKTVNETKQPILTKSKETSETKSTLPTKPEDIGKETKTTSMDMDTWFARINDMLVNANKLTGTKHRDALKSVAHAYNNYKAKGGTKTIDALEDTNKLDFKDKLLSKMDVRKLPNTDNQGNKLSKEQQEFFKDSKVRDENGNLLYMYHGTPNGKFNIFDKTKFGMRDEGFLGEGFYFTKYEEDAIGYATDDVPDTRNAEIKKIYLNIKNPYIVPSHIQYGNDMLINELGVKTPRQVTTYLKSKGYDGIIYRDGMEVVAFESNQIKNVDNLNPTESNDMRYLPTKTSKFAENIHDKGLFSDLVDYVKTHPELTQYETTSHKEDYAKAVEMIKKDAVTTIETFMSKTSDQLNTVDVQIGKMLMHLYKQYNDVASEIAVYNKIKEGGTTKGQYIEALKIFKELSPTAVVMGIQNDLTRAYEEMQTSGDPTIRDWIKHNASKATLTEPERKWIYSMADSVKDLDPASRKYQVTYGLINEFIADRIPKTFTTKLKTFRRIGMLFNLKTQVRNTGGNAIMVPINAAVDFVASKVDKRLSKKTNVRTTGTLSFKQAKQSFKTGVNEVIEDAKLGITTRSIGDAYDLPRGRTFNNNTIVGKALNWSEKATNYMLEGGDRGFEQIWYDNSLNNQMKLAGVTEPTETMKQIAQEEASKRTWKNNSKMVQIASSARETLNKIHIGDLGMGDIILPFIMTPANLAVATYEYSPAVGLSILKNARAYNNAVKAGNTTEIALTQKQLVDSIGKGTVGTLLYVIAAALAKGGKITGDEDEDKDIRNLMKAQGFQPFSINIGNQSYTYDWAQPIASPFAIMAELERTTQLTGEKQSLLEALVKAFSIGGTRLYEQSFLSSLKTLFSGDDMFEGVVDTAMSVPASFVPTLFSQVANLMDSSTKVTYDNKSNWKTMLYKAGVKIPGVKSLLPNKYNVLGEQVEIYNGKNNIINVMLNPSNVSGDTVGDLGAEIMDVYNHTGENSVIPQVVSTYIDYTVNGVKHRATFSTAQQAELQQAMGKIAKDALNEMLLSDVYNTATYEQKAKALVSLTQYARAKAIEDSGYAEGYTIKSGNASQIKKYIENGLSISNAVMYDGILSNIEGIPDETTGITIEGSKNGQKAYLIMNMPVTTEQKNIMLQLISPTANRPETVDSLSNLKTQQEFIDYYSLSRGDYMVMNNYSRDDYDIAVGYYNFTSRDFIKYTNDMGNIKSDYDEDGKSISGSKKQKIVNYINKLPLSSMQKIYLYYQAGYSIKPYKTQIYNYINGLNISVSEKEYIWKSFGF